MASKGHFCAHIEHPLVHNSSLIFIFLSVSISLHFSPILFDGHTFMQRYPPHPCGLHRSLWTIAMRLVILYLSYNSFCSYVTISFQCHLNVSDMHIYYG